MELNLSTIYSSQHFSEHSANNGDECIRGKEVNNTTIKSVHKLYTKLQSLNDKYTSIQNKGINVGKKYISIKYLIKN